MKVKVMVMGGKFLFFCFFILLLEYVCECLKRADGWGWGWGLGDREGEGAMDGGWRMEDGGWRRMMMMMLLFVVVVGISLPSLLSSFFEPPFTVAKPSYPIPSHLPTQPTKPTQPNLWL